MVQAKWTDRILDECFDNIIADRPELSAQALARTAGHSGGTSRLSGRSPTHYRLWSSAFDAVEDRISSSAEFGDAVLTNPYR